MTLKVTWIDGMREPQCPPDPNYPSGRDLKIMGGGKYCRTSLPYPAKRCGYYAITCTVCKLNVAVTTAGRLDDPRSVEIPCQETPH